LQLWPVSSLCLKNWISAHQFGPRATAQARVFVFYLTL